MLPQVDALGRVYVAPAGVPVAWNSGVGYDALGRMCTTTVLGINDQSIGAWRLDPVGRVVTGALGQPAGVPIPIKDYNLTGPTLPADVTFTRASAATYFDSVGALQDAAIDAPRFDYDPSTHAALGLLIEEARTNLVLNNAIGITQGITVTAVAHTLSFVGTGSVALSGAFVGSLAGIGPGFSSRVSLTFTPTAGPLTLTVTGSVQWLQVEIGVFATSIIKTAGVPVSRAIDVALVGTVPFAAFWNQLEGTIVATAASNTTTPAQFSRFFTAQSVNSAADALSVSRSTDPNQSRITSIVASAAQVAMNIGLMPAGARSTVAAAYKLNNYAASADGAAPVVDTVGTVPTVDRMYLGSINGTSGFLNGVVKSLRYWNTRLTDTQLQALSLSSTDVFYNGGLPFNADGSMAVQTDVVPALFDPYVRGIRVGANGVYLTSAIPPGFTFLDEMSVGHILTVGINPGGTRVGYRRNEWGAFLPNDVASLERLFTNLNNSRLVVQATGDWSMLNISNIRIERIVPPQISNFGPPSNVIFDGVSTDFIWIVPGFDFVLGENYEVSLS